MSSSLWSVDVVIRIRALLADAAALRGELAETLARSGRIARRHPRWIRGGSRAEATWEPDSLRRDVRGRLIEGSLPSPGRLVWAGRGLGHTCSVCRRSIPGTEIEYEVRASGADLFAHVACFDIWTDEVSALRAAVADGDILGPS